jgi:hypothetical protein
VRWMYGPDLIEAAEDAAAAGWIAASAAGRNPRRRCQPGPASGRSAALICALTLTGPRHKSPP